MHCTEWQKISNNITAVIISVHQIRNPTHHLEFDGERYSFTLTHKMLVRQCIFVHLERKKKSAFF